MKLGVVRRGWKLLRVLSVRVEPAKFDSGRLPFFEPTKLEGQTVTAPGGWRGGERWPSSSKPLPWGIPGVV